MTWHADLRPAQKALLTRAIEKWNAEQDDPDNRVLPGNWWVPNQKALDAYAANTKGEVALDGVTFRSERSMSSRRTR